MELIPITSDRIEEIAETSSASQKSRKNLEINQKVEFTFVRSCSKRYELKCIVEKCGWNVRATRIKNSTLFRVIKYHNNHECSIDARKSDQKHATSNFISEQIIEHVRNKKIEVTPAFGENKMKKKFGIDIGYHKAWRAIQKAIACIRGTPEENYQILPSYLHMMVQKNPGTYTSIKRDEQNRAIIAVDAMFLKSKYYGVLFVAVSKDANNQIVPLSFGIAESKNNEAYIWFFGEMRKAVQVRRELVFLSDRNQSIANGIRKVYPEAHHGICLYHFEKNLKQRHAKATVINLFQSAARSYKREDFNQLMSQLKSVDKKTYNYIMEEPPERWARSWFLRRRMLTTNMVESMNSVLLKAREMPILRMLDFIQKKLGEWFYERRKKANETFHKVSIWAEEEMTKKMDLACKIFVFNLDSMLFRINSEGIEFIVDLKKRTCDCLEFQLDELPCPHAIAAINKRYLQKSNYCSNWYSKKTWLKTYEGHVNTVGHQKSWDIPQNVEPDITKPSDVEILQGRRQKKRHIPATESVPLKSTKCSRCKQVGHNKTTCLSSPALHPYSKKHTEKYSNLQ
ncbi:PREDICTED: uncharacterized protein LOC109208851 [Nicotiana attenuata]|uniref:uncharacterized protein LOC109208851 n=1 Tax=Nicotiana attenuata TaxID=49451 RepID=UPI0009046E19|nr:PREDICTED: uncharacterized protein LOC109208851 [Nicotiana attenuata]